MFVEKLLTAEILERKGSGEQVKENVLFLIVTFPFITVKKKKTKVQINKNPEKTKYIENVKLCFHNH